MFENNSSAHNHLESPVGEKSNILNFKFNKALRSHLALKDHLKSQGYL